jgi:POT family proton-dependent oligopeptide transporter
MTIFAKDNTQRILTGVNGLLFKYIDAGLTISSLLVITYVLYLLMKQTFKKFTLGNSILGFSFLIIWAIVIWKTNREFSSIDTEVPASWFGVLNSLFIIFFAPLFTKLWDSKYNFSAPLKFGLGFLLLGLGFGFLAYGALPITAGNELVKVSMVWLILAYLFHTLGELCLYPVSLSYVTKLVPMKWMGIAFGVYLLSLAMGNKLAGMFGSQIEQITADYSLSEFFLLLTIVPIGLGIVISAMNPLIKRLMHGVN